MQFELNFDEPVRHYSQVREGLIHVVETYAGFTVYRTNSGRFVAGHDAHEYATKRGARASALRQKGRVASQASFELN